MDELADSVKFQFPTRFHALADMMKAMAECAFDLLHKAMQLPSDPIKNWTKPSSRLTTVTCGAT
jgi:hypothetical protein